MILDRSHNVDTEVSQKPLVIEGWSYGFNKVAFTKMLQKELGYSLSVAKNITDQVLTTRPVALLVPESNYERVSHLSSELGATVRQELRADSRGDICL
jgi:hypothetical protein